MLFFHELSYKKSQREKSFRLATLTSLHKTFEKEEEEEAAR
jgi:hypothetical protein